MHMRTVTVLLAACGLAAAAGAQSPRHVAETSWGKPGVSLEDYAVDGGLCAYRATMADVSDTEAARILVAATRRLDRIESALGLSDGYHALLDHRRVVETARPRRQFEAIAELQQGVLEACLVERGYRQFRLTDDQVQQLRRLRRGSPERRAYLHSLGSDPQVLERQGLPPGSAASPQG